MHERSSTIQRPDGKWVNVYGKGTLLAGTPLEPHYHYEKDAYASESEASSAAKRRSLDFEQEQQALGGEGYARTKPAQAGAQ